jgi:hypothetical protein
VAVVYLAPSVALQGRASAQAKDLYRGVWYTAIRSYIERRLEPQDRWFVVSPLYGLLDPEQVVAPYEETLSGMHVRERLVMATRVVAGLEAAADRSMPVYLLCGDAWVLLLQRPLAEAGWTVLVPLRGDSEEEQVKWLRAAGPR